MRQINEFVQAFTKLGRAKFLNENPDPILMHLRHVVMQANFRTVGDDEHDTAKIIKRHDPPVHLVWIIKKSPGSAYPGRISVGRTKATDLLIDYAQLSKFHAYFTHEYGDWYLTDAGSTNGTFLDDVRLEADKPQLLSEGSVIVLGKHQFRFYSANEFAALLQGMTKTAK